MNIHPDFEELLRLLEENHAEYLIIGGYAVAFHGFPRFTKDIDVFYSASGTNIPNIRKSLLKFGFSEEQLPDELFATKGNIITFGVEPARVDFLNDIPGVDFGAAWPNRIRGRYGCVEVSFISRLDLIRNKKSTPRAQDKIDADELSE
jgi:hypothetical protein